MKRFFCCIFLLLTAAILPLSAFAAQLPAEGQYIVEVTLSGGSGRATVTSPAEMTVTDGAMTAVIVWSSPYYDFMLVDGAYYYPINTDGNSIFEIPVAALDEDLAVSAETVAMSEPHVIDYTLRFNSASLTPLAGHGAWTATKIILIAAVILAALAAVVCLVIVLRQRGQRRKTSE